jgi:4-hydroxythreonine-4-phosphate dehydrogenase
VNKNTIAQNHPNFTGHTGYIGQATGAEPLMILADDTLRVALVTGHIALKDVSAALSIDLVAKRIQQLQKSMIEDFGIRKPKIAVLGLNPHASDNGVMGDEEDKIIIPAIEKVAAKGHVVLGPYPADGFFGAETYKQFDAVLAMYHDQGLVPFKTLAFEAGVNYTAGLPMVRTSPDHGTGYDIAGSGVASEKSFREAVFLALEVIKNRAEYAELTAAPLKMGKRERDN